MRTEHASDTYDSGILDGITTILLQCSANAEDIGVLLSCLFFYVAIIDHNSSIRGLEEIGWPIEELVQIGWTRQHMIDGCTYHHTAHLQTDVSEWEHNSRAYIYLHVAH